MSQVNLSGVFEEAWKGIKDDLALAGGLSLVYFLAIGVAGQIPMIGIIFSMPLTAGYMKCLLKIRAREVMGFEDFFWGFRNFNRFLHLAILYAFVWFGVTLGLILLLIPGIWWLVVSTFAGQVVVLRDMEDSLGALKKSKELVQGRWWSVFGFVTKVFLINFAGLICFFVGVLVAFPVTVLASLIAAERLLAAEAALVPTRSQPSTVPASEETAAKSETQTP